MLLFFSWWISFASWCLYSCVMDLSLVITYSCGIVKISSDWTDIYPLPIYAVLNHNSLFTNWIPPGLICLMLKQKIWCGSFNCILLMVHKFPSMLFLPHCFQGFHLRFFSPNLAQNSLNYVSFMPTLKSPNISLIPGFLINQRAFEDPKI